MDEIRRIAVGSTSPIKLRAVRMALSTLGWSEIEVQGCDVESGVPAQPVGPAETFTGALNRARRTLDAVHTTAIGIGVENGLVFMYGQWFDIPFVVVQHRSIEKPFIAQGTGFPIPKWLAEKAVDGKCELGTAVQELAKSYAGVDYLHEKDPMWFFSDGGIKRQDILSTTIQCALMPMIRHKRYAHQ